MIHLMIMASLGHMLTQNGRLYLRSLMIASEKNVRLRGMNPKPV